MVTTALLIFFLAVPLVVFLHALIAQSVERRRARRRRHGPDAIAVDERTERVATQLLLTGSIERAEYRRAMEVLAAHDAKAHPLHIPG